ncbi:MAG: gamma-glutamyltransferase, partial [Rhodospirillales bacterium]|nr:gamma-glutamyltransferase [Rhodospirillales bacterium]
SLGGGGICITYDPKTNKAEVLDFLTRPPRDIPASASRPSAVPGNSIGFFALHSRYGRLQWGEMIGSAEKLARFGTQASRSLIKRLQPVAAALVEDPGAKRVFVDAEGKMIQEGDFFRQEDLSTTLAMIRSRGPLSLYRGNFADRLAEAALAVGGSLSPGDLRAYRPRWQETVSIRIGNAKVHFTAPPAAAGLVAAQMMAMLGDKDRFEDGGETERAHLLAETALRSFGERARWLKGDNTSSAAPYSLLGEDHIERLMSNYRQASHLKAGSLNPKPVIKAESPSATSFLAIDPAGGAVSCTLSMNNNFGVGRMAQGTGILLAANPQGVGRGPISLGPMLMVNHNTKKFIFAGAAAGGAAAATAMVNVAARAIFGNDKLSRAMAKGRLHHGGMPDITYYEPNMPSDIIAALKKKGHRTAATPILGGVNAAYCPGGLPQEPDSCQIQTDPRGFGLALSATE